LQFQFFAFIRNYNDSIFFAFLHIVSADCYWL